ncbi:hemolysin family protein [Tissierella sp.]|uniref:hemolysin family protein n=1 Tax=Tissierella sp. TaxID=41274 RepID=UPI002862E631|nr:hemolysin family protein [Tissierella sp.]MDR7857330.1 hemolysin family protein [Tissierella sp.]
MGDESGAPITGQLLLILFLTLLNAFFAASEMAMVSVDKKKLLVQADEGNKKAKLLIDLLKEPSRFLSTIQVGITFAGFFSSASAAVGISDDFGMLLGRFGVPFAKDVAFISVTLILSYITLVFGELVPKRVALQNAEKFSMFAIKTVSIVSKMMSPFITFLSYSTNMIMRILGITTDGVEEKITLEEIRSMVEVGQEQGVINPSEREMIDNVIGFDDKLAEEIMTARTEVFMIDLEDPIEEYISEMLQLKYSRIPVYEGDVDDIVGILYIKDFLLEAYKVGFENLDIRKILRPAYFIPERKNINDLFMDLQNSKKHMAVLIDEYGGFSGIVTMEDLIEEIVGDIDDEYDHDEPDIRKIDDYNYYAKGVISIKELNSNLGTDLDEDSEDFDTLGGFLIDIMGYIPEDGEKEVVEYEDIEFHIEEINEKRIQVVHIILREEEVPPELEENLENK